ncbi:cysteine protease ATG4D [Eupeodes corollae]|uniref:cysteine protease ATG4D n=1 Tax=Eupeodes corollae TaxID=290404 RepID=UPI002490CFAF|nr:cysteine protease ATG4D [Eupeodes corollae]XP_055923801.1 cysteine protease ATG4D [Eupeodes corollae]
MSYDGLLSKLTDEKLNFYPTPHTAVEEEQPAILQQTVGHDVAVIAAGAAHSKGGTKSETSTPQRKVSTSRFMNAFSQFYAGGCGSGQAAAVPSTSSATQPFVHAVTAEDDPSPSNSAGRTPTKGMESKLLSMWHNVKYGWSGKIRSNFSKEQPVWLLGRCYHRKYTPPTSMESSAELTASLEPIKGGLTAVHQIEIQVDESLVAQELGMDAIENQAAENPWEEGIEGFKRDFYSRLWMTYRREFPIMNGSNYTSDCGWGCMLRSGQMLLAQGLLCHFLGRSWRWDPETQLHSTYEDNLHRKIIKWFGDSSSKNSPFSIHALVNLGQEMGKKPGDWYGPASVSHLLRQAVKNAAQENADFDNIVIYVAQDCTIYIQDIHDECFIPDRTTKYVPWQTNRKPVEDPSGAHPQPQQQVYWKSLIILIPLRLGTEKLNPAYAHCLKLLLSTEYCIGVIGGRPKHSLYFVGFQEDKLIHLDPHYCQEMVDVNQENFCVNSFHCKSPRKLKTAKMDPSCCIGFYCQTKTDFDNFVENVQMYLHPIRFASPQTAHEGSPSQCPEMNYPLFTFSRGSYVDQEKDEPHESVYKPLQRQLAQLQHELCGSREHAADDDDGETEEFVIL